MGVYPFMFGATKDFEPVVNELIEVRTASAGPHQPMLMTL